MTIQIIETQDLKHLPPNGVGTTLLMDDGKVRTLLLNLATGHSVAPCQMPFTVLYYVIEGRGHLQVKDEQAELQMGSLIVVPAGAVRAISAAEPMHVLALQVL